MYGSVYHRCLDSSFDFLGGSASVWPLYVSTDTSVLVFGSRGTEKLISEGLPSQSQRIREPAFGLLIPLSVSMDYLSILMSFLSRCHSPETTKIFSPLSLSLYTVAIPKLEQHDGIQTALLLSTCCTRSIGYWEHLLCHRPADH